MGEPQERKTWLSLSPGLGALSFIFITARLGDHPIGSHYKREGKTGGNLASREPGPPPCDRWLSGEKNMQGFQENISENMRLEWRRE
jgi:hypothetical protein